MILRFGHEPFKYTVMSALKLNSTGMWAMSMGLSDIEARDAIYKMEIADLVDYPILSQRIPFFQERKAEFDSKIAQDFFRPHKNLVEVVHKGREIHQKLKDYLVGKVFEQEDVDF